MPTTARALNHTDRANDTHTASPPAAHDASKRPAKTVASKARRARHPDGAASQRKATSRQLKVAQVALAQAKKHASPLLIGAGLGATVAFSVVALRTREKPPTVALFASPNSTFFSAIVKTAAFAIGRIAAKGSLVGLAARVVEKVVE